MKDLIEFGKIVNTHGLKGEMKVYSYTDNNARILKLKKVYIDNICYNVESIKTFKNMFLMKLKEVNIIEEAEKFMNKMCFREVEKNESNAEEGFFIKDLIGIDVFGENKNKLGTLKEVFSTGANDVYEVITEDGKSIYLPAIESVIKDIDIINRKMTVKIMEGLI